MKLFLPAVLTLSIIAGQLLRISLGGQRVATLLDISITALCLIGLLRIKFKLSNRPQFIGPVLFFIIVAILSLIFSPLSLTTSQYFTSLSYTIRFFLYILAGWLIFSNAFPIIAKNIPQILTISGLGLAVVGLLQFIFLPDLTFLQEGGWDPHYYRTVSTFMDPNFVGAFFVLTLILLIKNFSILRKWDVAAFTILYLALMTTFSRSSYLMFFASGLTLSFLKKSKALTLSTMLLFSGLMLGFYIYSATISEPRNIDRAQSAQFRLETWRQGWELFKARPILGVGFNAYRAALKEYNLADEQFISSHGGSSNDSSLLFVVATTGLVGLVSYLFFLFSLLKEAWRKNFVLVSALSGLAVHSFFSNSLFFPPILAWIILISIASKK